MHRFRFTEILNFRGWTFSANWHFASGMPYMNNSSSFNAIEFSYLPDFMQLDVSMVKQFDFKIFYADIGMTVLNVLDHKNEIANKNFRVPEGNRVHNASTKTLATSFSPLFYINLRYE